MVQQYWYSNVTCQPNTGVDENWMRNTFILYQKNWFVDCRDYNLGLLHYPQTTKINISQSVDIHITLTAPLHRINGNDSMEYFNGENFQEEHILTITRVKDGPKTSFIPTFNGGGYDLVPTFMFSVDIE